MKRRSPPPRNRPVDDAAEPPILMPAFPPAHFQPESASEPAIPAEPRRTADARADWRERLAALAEAGALTAAQEADCFRLFQTQETETREAMPRLLAELKPHFDTDGEMQAKQRFTEALQEMKRKQHQEVARLLESFGMDSTDPSGA